jgi:hypothetical protein
MAELERVVVVLGAYAEELPARIDFGRAEPVVCDRSGDGLAASLCAGARALAAADPVTVTRGDVPTVSAAVVRRFLDAPPGARASYSGRPGHPVVLGAPKLELLLCLAGDTGARGMLGGGPQIECSDLCSGRDITLERIWKGAGLVGAGRRLSSAASRDRDRAQKHDQLCAERASTDRSTRVPPQRHSRIDHVAPLASRLAQGLGPDGHAQNHGCSCCDRRK